MSKFIDKLNKLSRGEPQPIGFVARQPVSLKPKIQLVAVLAEGNVKPLTDYITGADAGLLCVSKLSSGVKALEKISQAHSDIPWGVWLQDDGLGEIKQMDKVSCDFVVFPAISTPLAILQNDEVGKILEVETSLSEGLLRAVNELPVDAVFIAGERRENFFLTWQHLMLFRRFAELSAKPLLVSVPLGVTASELQALWEAGVDSVVVELSAEQSRDRLKELREVIDELAFPSQRRRESVKPLLSRISEETGVATTEEEEEEE